MGAATVLAGLPESVSMFIERVRQEIPVTAVYVFGSYARGEEREDSDIDLLVVSPAFTGTRFYDNSRIGVLTWGIDTRIEPWGFRPEDFNDDHMIPAEVLRSGIRIFPAGEAQETDT